MKVLLVNGSSRKNGCTNTALSKVARALDEEGIKTEIFFIGNLMENGLVSNPADGTSDLTNKAPHSLVVYFSAPDDRDNSYVEIDGKRLGNPLQLLGVPVDAPRRDRDLVALVEDTVSFFESAEGK